MMRGGAPSSRFGAVVLAGAIMAAPFIALLFRPEAGLIVMAIGLGATTMLLRDALGSTPVRSRRWLRLAAGVNLLLALACVALALWLVSRG